MTLFTRKYQGYANQSCKVSVSLYVLMGPQKKVSCVSVLRVSSSLPVVLFPSISVWFMLIILKHLLLLKIITGWLLPESMWMELLECREYREVCQSARHNNPREMWRGSIHRMSLCGRSVAVTSHSLHHVTHVTYLIKNMVCKMETVHILLQEVDTY